MSLSLVVEGLEASKCLVVAGLVLSFSCQVPVLQQEHIALQ